MGKQKLDNRIATGYTIILNHSRGWGGKPSGSLADSRVAEISGLIFRPGFFVVIVSTFRLMLSNYHCIARKTMAGCR